MKHLFTEIATEFEFEIKEMEVMPDHCHVFVTCHPKKSPSDIVKCLKGINARKLLIEYPVIKQKLWGGHLWNPSYYIGTVGNMSKDVVRRYIQSQKSESTGKFTSPNDRHKAFHPLNEFRKISAKFSKIVNGDFTCLG